MLGWVGSLETGWVQHVPTPMGAVEETSFFKCCVATKQVAVHDMIIWSHIMKGICHRFYRFRVCGKGCLHRLTTTREKHDHRWLRRAGFFLACRRLESGAVGRKYSKDIRPGRLSLELTPESEPSTIFNPIVIAWYMDTLAISICKYSEPCVDTQW